MPPPLRLLCAFAALVGFIDESFAAADKLPRDAFAPAVKPRLLFASRFGGAGDQWFSAVQIKGNRAQGVCAEGLSLTVVVGADDSVKATKDGDPEKACTVQNDLPNGGKTGPYTYGYHQVDPNLQQPFLDGPDWKLWGWTLADAKASKAGLGGMADSRIKGVWILPSGNLFVSSYCDGGNTMLRAHPANRDLAIKPKIEVGGGGGGRSAWLFEVTPDGHYNDKVVACRGKIVCHAVDAWGRLMVGGDAVFKTGGGKDLGYDGGPGVLMMDDSWSTALLRANLGGKTGSNTGGMIWSIDIDSKSGLAVVGGFVTGDCDSVHAVQDKPGAGKDAFLAVIRLWTPAEYAEAVRRDPAGKTK